MGEKVGFVVVGIGHIGKRHIEEIQNNSDTKLIALVDTDPKKSEIAKQYNLSFYSELNDFLSSDLATSADVINICTPNHTHAPLTIKSLESGFHVVCEKPMALSVKESSEIIATSQKCNKHVFCVMQNRFSPPSQWLKELINSNMLGDVYLVNIDCYWNRDHRYYDKSDWKGIKEKDGGALFTQFSHFVDVMYWLFGEVTNVSSMIRNFNHPYLKNFDDSGSVNFEFKNGAIGNFSYSTSAWDKNMESSIVIIGEKGSVKVSGQYMDKLEYCHISDYTPPKLDSTKPPNDYGHFKGSASNHQYIIENVVNVLNHNGTIKTTAEDGMHVVEIIEQFYSGLNLKQ